MEFDYDTTDGATRITCSNPCLAAQYVKRNIAGGSTAESGAYMATLTPDTAFASDVHFSVPPLSGESSALTSLSVVVNSYPVDYLYLNGDSLESLAWLEIQAGGRWYATVDITTQDNNLYSTSGDGR